MEYDVLHDIPGRMRVNLKGARLNRDEAEVIGKLLSAQEGVVSAALSLRTGNLLIRYSHFMPRKRITDLLDVLEASDWEDIGLELAENLPSFLEMSVAGAAKTIAATLLKLLFLPRFIRYGLLLAEAAPFVAKGLNSLRQGKLDINALDATSLSILAVRRDFTAMRSILWMLAAAESFNEWTRGHSRYSLAESLDLGVEEVWLRKGNEEFKSFMTDVAPGDLLIARTGWLIPVDGVVVEGEALVNQSVLTGESEAVRKAVGLSVFAGSVVDEGEVVILVENTTGESRLQSIIAFIEESEACKGDVQSKAERMANALAPCNFALSFIVLVLSRDPVRASSVLMADYSCATRLATPLTILSAMMEGVKHGVLIKGGKHIEAMAQADSLVIDKTGTLTRAKPSVLRVAAFNGWTEAEVLSVAACLEEHFPHPIGRAVVKKAETENLSHRERHAKPAYVPAHGIVSRFNGKPIAIGSAHFLFDDLGVAAAWEVEREAEAEAAMGRSLLYMAHDGWIVGLLAIEDPIRSDASATLAKLKKSGVRRVAMLTGDGERTAKTVADALGIQSYRSGLLPVDKAELILEMKREGDTVMFVGDGVNDSPALSAADVGISLQDGSEVAKEMAGVVLLDGKLKSLAEARRLAVRAMNKIFRQFAFVVTLNSVLIGLGLLGRLSPRLVALLHNSGTMLVTANSIRPLLPAGGRGAESSFGVRDELLSDEAGQRAGAPVVHAAGPQVRVPVPVITNSARPRGVANGGMAL